MSEYEDDQNEQADEPVGQRLRVMSVMDVAPGRAHDPETGPPIGILLLANQGDMEQAMSFRLDEVKRLAVGMLAVLAHHGDETAEEIILKYYSKK